VSETRPAVTVEDISPVKKKLSIAVPWEETKRELESNYKIVARSAKIKGFRPGKAPRPLVESVYGEFIEEETIKKLVNRFFWDAVEERSLKPLESPEVEPGVIVQGQDFTFSATVEVEPLIEPQNYMGLELEREDDTVTDQDVQERLDKIRDMYATLEDVAEDRGVKAGDVCIIDFQGFIDGVAREDIKAEGHVLEPGSRTFVPEFEDALYGMKKGETKELDVNFPEDYHHKEMAGKTVRFSVTLREIREKKVPPLDEDFVKNLERFNTLEELTEEVRRGLEEERRNRADANLRKALIERLLEDNDFDVPDSLVKRRLVEMMFDVHMKMRSAGMRNDQVEAVIDKNIAYMSGEAALAVKTSLLLKAIAARERIVVEDEEAEGRVREMARQRGQDEEALLKKYQDEGLIEQVKGDLLARKTLDFIESHAKIRVAARDEKTAGEVS